MLIPVECLRMVGRPRVELRIGILDTSGLRGPLPLAGNHNAVRILALGGYLEIVEVALVDTCLVFLD